MARRSSSAMVLGSAMGSLASVGILLLVFLILVGIYLLFQAARLVITIMVKYPHSHAMRVALGFAIGCLVFTVVSFLIPIAGLQELALLLFGFSLASLVVTAYVVKLYNYELSLPEKEPLVTKVLKRPWWTKNEQLAQDAAA
jgi:hypothetical protein